MHEGLNMSGNYAVGIAHLLMWGFWLLIIALIIWVVIKLFQLPANIRGDKPSPRELLDARYAKGELDRDEYQRMRQEIESGKH